jgi:hypothetical protein
VLCYVSVAHAVVELFNDVLLFCQSQLPSGLRHLLFPTALTVDSWVHIPLGVWMCAFILCVDCHV